MIRKDSRWIAVPLALLAAAPLLHLLGQAQGFLVWPSAIYSDLLTAHLPLSQYIHESLLRWGTIPLWNAIWLGGVPLVGDPLAGLTYPPLWVTYLWPTPTAYQLVLAAHVLWGGGGAYLLGRRFGLRPLASWLVAAAFAGTPRLWGHWGLGHATLVLALTWTPWLLLAMEAAIAASVDRIDWARFGVAGAVLGVVACADPRWAPPAALLAILYLGWRVASVRCDRRERMRRLIGCVFAGVTGLGASAAIALPLSTYMRQSTRAAIDSADRLSLSLRPLDFLQVVLPDPTVWPERMAAVGIVVVMLAVVGLVSRSHPSAWFWAGAAVFGWVLGLGGGTPLGRMVSGLPVLSWMRVPARWSMLSALPCAVLAGIGLDSLLRGRWKPGGRRAERLATVAMLAVPVCLVIGLSLIAGWQVLVLRAGAVAALLFGIVGAWLVMVSLGHPGRVLPVVGLAMLAALELAVFNWRALEARRAPAGDVPAQVAGGAGWGHERLFSPDFSITQWAAARDQLELAGGVAPLPLDHYWRALSGAIGLQPNGYSVSLPPYPSGDPMVPAELALSPERLGWFNITRVVTPDALDVAGLRLEGIWRGERVYANEWARPRAWLQPAPGAEIDDEWHPTSALTWSPNAIEVTAQGPGRLVLSETMYPGWGVVVDGQPASVEPIEGVFRSVLIPAGIHQVTFRFVPWTAYIGWVLTVLCWLLLAIMWWARR